MGNLQLLLHDSYFMIHNSEGMHPKDQKSELRKAITERLLRLSDKDRAAESRSLCRRLLPLIPKGTAVCAFVPLKTEPDIKPLLEKLLDRGDRVFLPRFEGKLVFHEIRNLRELAPDELKIPAPPPDAPLLDPQELAVAIVPARAYDRRGWRLGRGNGGYDIWIREQRRLNLKTRFIGVALECQIVNEVPMEPHDERVDMVVTARGVVG